MPAGNQNLPVRASTETGRFGDPSINKKRIRQFCRRKRESICLNDEHRG